MTTRHSSRPLAALLFAATTLASAGCDPADSDTSSAPTGPESAAAQAPYFVELPGADIFPEGIAARADGTLFIGGMMSSTIYTRAPGTTSAEIWLAPGELQRGVIGLKVDESKGLLWACDAVPQVADSSDLVGIDLVSATVQVRHSLPTLDGVAFCNDIALAPDGGVFVSESFGGRVMYLSQEDALTDNVAMSTWLDHPSITPPEGGFGANGIVVRQDAVYVLSFSGGSLQRVPIEVGGAAGPVTTIALQDTQGAPTSLVGPDGMALLDDGTLIVVENGAFAPPGEGNRLVRVVLDETESSAVVDNLTHRLDTPTTVAVHDGVAWMVEGQFDHLFGVDPAPALLPFTVVGVTLPQTSD